MLPKAMANHIHHFAPIELSIYQNANQAFKAQSDTSFSQSSREPKGASLCAAYLFIIVSTNGIGALRR